MMCPRLKLCLFAFALLLGSASLLCGVDVNVYNDAVYLYLDKLDAAGLLKAYMPFQRPLTRQAVSMLIKEAREKVREGDPLQPAISELEKEFADALSEKKISFVPLDSFALSYTATDQQESPVPYNGLGLTSGRVQPLLSYSNGDRFDGNGNVYSYSAHRLKAGSSFAAYLQPKFFARSGEDGTGGVGLYRGYLKTGYRDFEIQIGRDDIRWGPGENGIFFSGNARPLDMVKVSSPVPFKLPGILKSLGNFRASAFFSYLGGDYTPDGALLSGYRVDYSPVRWWNVGLDHAVFLFGERAESPNFGTVLRAFVGFLEARTSSNHLVGVDTSFHVPQAMGTQLYVKLLLEDTQAEQAYMLKSDASWMGGIYLPGIKGLERLSVRSEFIYTGQFPYMHSFYTDGFALEKKFIGYDAGPDTYSGMLAAKYQFNLDEFIRVDVRYLRRSGDHYVPTYDFSGDNIDIFRDIDTPEEFNRIIRLGGQKRLSPNLNLFAEAGYDSRRNTNFTAGKSSKDFAFRIGIIFHPSMRFDH